MKMTKAQNDVVILLHCSSMLEKKTSILYKKIAEKVQLPLVKSFLLQMVHDSQKHSDTLEGISVSIGKSSSRPKDCGKKLGLVWQLTEDLTREVSLKPTMSEEEMAQLIERLVKIEQFMGEEYYIFVQAKTLQLLTKEIRQIYNVNLENVKYILEEVIRDEETHQRLLATIKDILMRRKLKRQGNAPEVRYQSPDSWIKSFPSTY